MKYIVLTKHANLVKILQDQLGSGYLVLGIAELSDDILFVEIKK